MVATVDKEHSPFNLGSSPRDACASHKDDCPQISFTKEKINHKKSSIVISGYSLRGPKTSSVEEFVKALKTGEDLTTSNTRYPDGFLGLPPRQGLIKKHDIEGRFNPSFFGLNHIQAEAMDPAFRLILQVSYEALMDAQLDIQGIRGTQMGVYVGTSHSDTLSYLTGPTNRKKKTGYEIVNSHPFMMANRLSYFYDLKGPSLMIDTGCSASIVALDRAVRDIEAGIIDRAIVAGVNLTLDPNRAEPFSILKALSPTGRSHSYDSRANGYCRSEGIACIIIEVGTEGYARIAGIGNNSDGATTQGITYPNGQQQMKLMQGVFKKSMIDPETITYHEGHGTGTVAGDREELSALSKVYSHRIHIGSVKSNMGHAEAASGLFGLIKILLMYEDQLLYPNFDWRKSNHDAIVNGNLSVVQSCQHWKKGPCTLSSFGLGGSNAFVILLPTKRKGYFLSPKNGSPLTMRPFLSSLPDSSTSSIPSTMRSLYGKYYCIQRQLSNHQPFHYEEVNGKWTGKSPLVFVLDGQGAQWNKMGQDLMKNSTVFRSTIERLERETGIGLVDLYEDGTKWMEKTKTVIGIVSFQLGLIAVLKSHGISPDYFLGHSLGEVACAFLSDLQTEAEVMKIAQLRASLATLIDTNSRLDVYAKSTMEGNERDVHDAYMFNTKYHVKKSPLSAPASDPNIVQSFPMKGTMAVVGCDAKTLEDMIDNIGLTQTCVACYNSPKGQTVSGPTVEVDQLLEEVKKAKSETFIRTLATDNVAYHAPYLEIFKDMLFQEFNRKFGLTENQPIPSSWKSTSSEKTFGAEYIVNNICGKVYFQRAIESLPTSSTVIEIGPSSSLLSQIKRIRTDLKLVKFVERNTSVDLDTVLNTLKPQFSSSMEDGDWVFPKFDNTQPCILSYKERYPDIWGSETVFKMPELRDYCSVDPPRNGDEGFVSSTIAHTVCYDLRKEPWSSIYDHNIRGQALFPAAGYLHALWSSQRFKPKTQFSNFKIKASLLISPNEQEIKLQVYQTGDYCEVRGLDNTCHATAYVQQVLPTTTKTKPEGNATDNGLESRHFYSNIRRLGYTYGPSYQVLDNITSSHAKFGKKPKDWICYLDACLHMDLHEETVFFYPKGFDRVVFWGERLQKASMWIQKTSVDSVGNETVLIEGIKREIAPIISQSIPTYSEKFIKYHESDSAENPSSIASLLLRESSTFYVVEPVVSPSLAEVVREMRSLAPLAGESKQVTNLVISDQVYTDASLLLTTKMNKEEFFEDFPYCVVARWGDLYLVRRKNDDERTINPTVVTDWKDVPKARQSPFVWHGDGSSGAVACLYDERKKQKVFSYEGGCKDNLIGLEKSMRHNYIHNGAHGCWVDVKNEDDCQEQVTPHALLRIGRPGVLDSLEWHGIDADDYDTEIRASGLNFREVMRAMGHLKESDTSFSEISGVNVSTRERVFGFGTETIGTHTNALYTFPTPDGLSNEEAATIPVVYLTVYYAFLQKANIKKGQSILIHAGAGGVGFAAITVAQSRGLKIFATCSSKKRNFLKENFGLEDHQIGDSRSDSFVNTVLKGTNQRGVDIVLNQLAGELQVASLRCLASGGSFLEIGKYDIMENSSIGLALMTNNISFHVIDLLPMFRDPAYKQMFDKLLSDGFQRKEIVPLPVSAFNAKDIVSAFRYMSQGKHIGKVVINGYESCKFSVKQKIVTMKGESHLITGGLGGVGLALAYRLASLNCRELILVSRRGVTNSFQRQQIAKIEAMNCKVQVIKSDVAHLTPSLASPDCIWHTATLYKDVVFDEMTVENWEYVVKPKVNGYLKLRECWPTVRIVATSSVWGYYGGKLITGQTSYALSNAFLDQAARKDAKTLSIRLGLIDDVGYITGADLNRKVLEMSSLIPISMKIDNVLEKMLKISREHQSGVFGIYSFKEKKKSKIDYRVRGHGRGPMYSLQDARNLMATVMGGKPSQYHARLKLKDAGLDSLSKMEVVHHIHEKSGSKSFKATDIDETFAVEDIVSAIGTSTVVTVDSALNHDIVSSKRDKSELQYEYNEEKKDNDNNSKKKDEENYLQNSASVGEFIGNSSVKDENENLFLTVEVKPHTINSGYIINALTKAKFIIFRQSHPTIFNHGAPLGTVKDVMTDFMDQYVDLAHALSLSKAIIVVIVEGEVRGGGMIFPALADICLATPNSSFGLPEIHRGMVPAVVSQALKERLGNITTRRLALTGEPILADKALQISLIDNIVEESELERYLAGMLRRWEPRVSAAQFIKHDLLPTKSSFASMKGGGTRAGVWLRKQRVDEVKLDDREVLRVSINDGVATLIMCDEMTFNSASFEMTHAFDAVIPRLRSEAKAIILASSLDNFNLGLQASISRRYKGRPTHEFAAVINEMFRGFVELARLGIPIICVLNGRAYGGGVPVALWCDYRIVTSDVDLHVGNISRGVSPCGQLSQLLRQYFGQAEVMRHYLGNHHWYAEDLLRLGIVDHIKKSKSDAMKEAYALAKFIAKQPVRGVRDAIQMLKVSHAAELIDEEAWLMATKVTRTGDCFSNKDHGSFHFNEGGDLQIENSRVLVKQPRGSNGAVGIVAIEAYVPNYCIEADTLEEKSIPARTRNRQEAVAVWDGQEDVISMALNAVSMLLERHVKDPRMIGRIEVGTESNVDMAKSIKSYLMDLLPEGHKNVEGVDNTNACYGGAAAMINTLSWCRESEGRYGIVVATDTADMDLSDSSWRGASAVALLIGPNPWVEIQPERTSCFKNTHDFLKPRYSPQVSPFVQGQTSVKHYIDALDFTIEEFRKLYSINPSSFDTLIYHGGMCVTFQKYIEKHLLMNVSNNSEWQTTLEMSRNFGSKMGGLYTASLFVQLLSLLDAYATQDNSKTLPPLNHIGLFAYGSGSTATLFHAKIHHKRRHEINLGVKLAIREKVSFETLSSISKAHAEGVAETILPRLNGRYYFDASKKDQIIREYFKEGTSQRIAPLAPESHSILTCVKPTIVGNDKSSSVTFIGSENNQESQTRIKVLFSFLLGIFWWISTAVVFEPQMSILFTVIVTVVLCSLIHYILRKQQSSQNGSRICHLVSCTHYVQVTMTYIAHIVLYIISPALFDKYWLYITISWLTYVSGVMVSSKEAWDSIDRRQRLFWIIHHNIGFFVLGLRAVVSPSSWDDVVSIKSCFLFSIAQIWNASLNVYRNLYGNGSFTQTQITLAKLFVTFVEKLQQVYAMCLLFSSKSEEERIFWPLFFTLLLFFSTELFFQLHVLYEAVRKVLQQPHTKEKKH